jgi:diguanylate cyclase (GGDEF)-like protein
MKNDVINFYNFMHRQLFVVLLLVIGTAPGYILIGYLYTDMKIESIWFVGVLMVSLYGYYLYQNFPKDAQEKEKNSWLQRVSYFMLIYFSIWNIPFIYYVMQSNIHLHYIALATQIGSAVVASVILSSQKNLVRVTVISLMLPITIYFIFVGHVYSYLLAFFSIVLTFVLLHSSKNTHNYLLKSRYQAYHDYLTGLGNRRYFIHYLESCLANINNKYNYLLLIDLDYFKTINDTLGHDVGDKLLIEVANRMEKLVTGYDNVVSRLGGDEFCILSSSFDDENECLQEAKKFSNLLLNAIKEVYTIDGSALHISSSIGVSIINNPRLNATKFLKEADIAMYEAKHSGRNGVIVFNDELANIVEKKLEIERLLQFAIAKKEIYIKFQPQVNLESKMVGCEVLARWENAHFGEIGPDFFIPIAENTGYIVELGAYILEETFKTLQSWQKRSKILQQISINISMKQLLHKDFVAYVHELYKKYAIENIGTKIIFEITETSTSEDMTQLIAVMNELKKLGIVFSIDDFGTGYSSLSYIRDIPLYELKIDQSFIANLENEKQASLVKSIVDISKNLHLTTVAEGVETEEQREFLKALDCDLLQGYLFYKPMRKEELEQLIG